MECWNLWEVALFSIICGIPYRLDQEQTFVGELDAKKGNRRQPEYIG